MRFLEMESTSLSFDNQIILTSNFFKKLILLSKVWADKRGGSSPRVQKMDFSKWFFSQNNYESLILMTFQKLEVSRRSLQGHTKSFLLISFLISQGFVDGQTIIRSICHFQGDERDFKIIVSRTGIKN